MYNLEKKNLLIPRNRIFNKLPNRGVNIAIDLFGGGSSKFL